MKKILLLILAVILLSGCNQKTKEFDLILSDYHGSMISVHHFGEGKHIYSQYYSIKVKFNGNEIVDLSTAINDNKITVDDITKYMHLDSDKSKDGTLAYSFDVTENGFANNNFELIKCNYGNIQNYVIGVDIIYDVSICVNMLLNNNQ